MKATAFPELLNRLTVDCKDDGTRFTLFTRVDAIKEFLSGSNYQLIHEGSLSLIYTRKTDPSLWRVLVSSHIDCVYQNCFMEETDHCWKGTFDNSATNAIIINLTLHDQLNDDVVIAFTGDKEMHSGGAIEVMHVLHKAEANPEFGIVLDVTGMKLLSPSKTTGNLTY